MALSGTIYGSTNNQYIDSKIEWGATQSTSGNYSNILASLYYRRNNTGFVTEGTGSFSITINGTTNTVSNKHLAISTDWVFATNASVTVYHNQDGTKSTTISASGSLPPSSLSSTYCSDTITLNTIPRASTFTLSRTSITGGENETVTVNINRASSSFHHQICYRPVGGSLTTVDAGSATSKSITFGKDYCTNFPKTWKGAIYFSVKTYSGTPSSATYIGETTERSISYIIPNYSKLNPVSISVSRVDGTVPSSWGIYVKGKSKVRATFSTSSGVYGSEIERYVFAGVSSQGIQVTSGFINSVGSITLPYYVVDSRSVTSPDATYSITVVDYFNPSITSLEINRCLSNGTLDEDGTYISCKAAFQYASCNSKNSVTCRVSYRLAGTTNAYSTPTVLTNNVASVFGSGTVLTDKEYDVKVEIFDTFSSSSPYVTTRILPISARIMSIYTNDNGQSGIALGKVANEVNCLDARDWRGRFNNLIINDSILADFVVQISISGNWYSRKWNSGYLECYYKHTTTNISFSNSAQSWTNDLAMPSVLLTKYTYLLQASLTGWTSYSICWSDSTNSAISYAVRTTDGHVMNGLNQIRITAEIKGRWK